MRILYITHYNTLYGANKSLINLIDGLLLTEGVKIMLIAPKGPIINELKERNIEVFTAPFFNEVYSLTKERFPLIKGIVKFILNWCFSFFFFIKIRKEGVSLIHTNSSVTFIGAYLSFLLKKPHVWHVREYGEKDYNLKYSFGEGYFNYWIQKASTVLSISEALAEKRLRPINLKALEIVYNGVVFYSEIAQNPQQYLKGKTFIFGIVGLISKEKNQLEAIQAFAKLYKANKNIKLYIIGDGTDKKYLTQLRTFVKENKLESCVEFTGYQKDMSSYYNKMNVLLMCSKFEALGRVTIEAMAKGVVVIGYNNAGTAEIINDEVNGLLYNSDYHELADKMDLLLKNSLLLNILSKNALDSVKEKYSIESYSNKILSFYKHL